MIKRFLLLKFLLLLLPASFLFAQTPYALNDQTPQHIFCYGEIERLEDPSGKLTIGDITKPEVSLMFKKNEFYTPKANNFNSTYWFKIKIKHNSQSKQNWILEFFDQTIDHLSIFVQDDNAKYIGYDFGDSYKFKNRAYHHKNFTIDIANRSDSIKTYYIKIKSSQSASAIIVLRSVHWFVEYALDEYLAFGLFYGMVLVFSLYNILMYFAIRQKQYLYYVLYNLSIGFYEMCVDGIAFQYFWPNFSGINQYSFGISLYLSSVFGLFFTLNFLYLKNKSPLFYRLVIFVIAVRTLFFVLCIFNNEFFSYKIIEIIPLLTAYSAGLFVYFNGYKPARFFVLGYSFLFLGFIIKLLIYFNVSWLPYGPITHYSLSFCFVIEMIFVSFAIGDNIRHLRKKKDKVQKRMIAQLQENEKLKDNMNQELTFLVDERTKELREKAEIILQQSEEISRMNALLKEDNEELQVNIEKVTRARVMSQDVDFEEFSKIYPDRDTCYKYLSVLKWKDGYQCKKCGSSNYLSGQLPYSRRCTKCRYEESVINNTIFQNSRIPINKAFYMLYLIYSTKGKISSHKLSEILSIRQGTCWSYSSKMKKLLDDRKKEIKNAGAEGWSKIVLEHPSTTEV